MKTGAGRRSPKIAAWAALAGTIAVAGALLFSGSGPGTGAAAAGDFVLVTEWGEFGGSGIAKIDPSTDQIIARASITGSPRHIAADQTRRLAYFSLHYADKVAAVKADTLEVADLTIPGLGRAPIGVTLTPDGLRMLVATRGDDGVYSADDRLDVVSLDPTVWPPTASLVTSISTGLHPIQAIVDSAGRYAVVTVRNQPAILVIDLTTYQVVWQAPNLPANAEPEGGDAHPTQNVVYVTLHGTNTIEVIDLDLMTITQHVPITNSLGIPTQPSTVRFTPDGSRAYVSGQTVGRVLMFDTSDPRNPVQDPSVELPVGPQPHHIEWLPGDRAYVANTNNMQPYGSLSVISNYSGVPSVSGPILTDLAGPLSFAYFPATPTPTPAALPYESSPFGFHPASTGALPNLSYSGAQDIGVRWHRPPVYAFWFLVQPNLGSPSYDWTLYDDQYGSVPAGINILANITLGPESEGYSMPGSYLPVDTPAYQTFVRATIERYDGDGVSDMPGLVTPIRYWQVDNEPGFGPSSGRTDFAQLQSLTYTAVKDACPDCRVLIGGATGFPTDFVNNFLTTYVPFLQALNGQYVDIFDFHWYGNATGDYRPLGQALTVVQTKLQETGFAGIPIWVTEMGTYSGDPAEPYFPYQSEEQQAGDLLRRFVYPISLGIQKIFPAFGLIEGFIHNDGYFDHTGLIYDGQGSGDLGAGVKKLGYYTYRLMTQKLEVSTFQYELTGLPTNVYGYVFTAAGGGSVTVLWYDNFAGGPATQDVTLATTATSVLVTNAVTDQQGNVTSIQVPVTGGAAMINLGSSPVFVEASSAVTYTTETLETWVTAPNGNQVYTRVVQPAAALYPGQRFPAVVAIPGGTGAGAPLAGNPGYVALAA